MHEKGCFGADAKTILRKLEKQVKELCRKLGEPENFKEAEKSKTLVIVTADHGHIDTKGVSLTDYPKLCECLLRLPSIEPRALNFFIKPGMKEQFKDEFNRKFSDKFMLLTKEEVLEKKLFGEGRSMSHSVICLAIILQLRLAICVYIIQERKRISSSVPMPG